MTITEMQAQLMQLILAAQAQALFVLTNRPTSAGMARDASNRLYAQWRDVQAHLVEALEAIS